MNQGDRHEVLPPEFEVPELLETSRSESDRSPSTTAVHPILVGLTESHDQRKGWIAQRSAVDL
jgi:hypothetical protein